MQSPILTRGAAYLRRVVRDVPYARTIAGASLLDLSEDEQKIRKYIQPHFDAQHYRSQAGGQLREDIGLVDHYIKFGRHQGYAPNDWFDIAFYLSHNRVIRENTFEPFSHFVQFGVFEGRRPNASGRYPDMLNGYDSDAVETISDHLDAEHYLSQATELRNEDVNLCAHYVHFGEVQGLSPNPTFDGAAYVQKYLWGRFPPGGALCHYIKHGKRLGYTPLRPRLRVDPLNEIDLIALYKPQFDEEYYTGAYEDVHSSALTSIEHFVQIGEVEGRWPKSDFDPRHYRREYMHPDDTEGRPFEHYLRDGLRKGSRPNAEVPCAVDPNATVPKTREYGHFFKQLEPSEPRKAGQLVNGSSLRIHFVIPDFRKGSGGHMTIFRMVKWLEVFGHDLTVWILSPSFNATEDEARDVIHASFQTIKADVKFLDDTFHQVTGDALIATAWQTAAVVRQAEGFAEKFYFVQDHESEFYPTGTEAILAEQTYSWGLNCICASPWLRHLMEGYGSWARHFWLAYDHTVYFAPDRRPQNRIPQIAVYARHFTARRAVELSMLALQELANSGVEFHAHLFGAPYNVENCPFPATSHGVMSETELANLYRDCDIGICFSATNYSLVPQEMMACGLPVVELNSECSKEVYPDDAVLKVGLDPVDIVRDLRQLIESPDYQERIGAAGKAWAEQFTWESSARMVEVALFEKLPQAEQHVGEMTPRASVTGGGEKKATVIIPTYNGGELLSDVCAAVDRQSTPWDFDVLLIDSTSKDGSFDAVREQFPHFQFHQIPQSEFSHGGTRNRAIEKTTSEYVCLLTQDALPSDELWLYNMVIAMDAYPNAAGAFGRHKPYDHATEYTKRDLEGFFSALDNGPVAYHRRLDAVLWNLQDRPHVQRLHYFSDNNSCLRRSVWEKIPYPEISYGEDQAWAWEVVKHGYEKIYVSSAQVYHSHDYDYEENYQRSKTEAEFFREVFGYNLLVCESKLRLSLSGLNKRDVTWGEKNGLPQDQIDHRLMLNQAHLLGWLDGTLGQNLGFRPVLEN